MSRPIFWIVLGGLYTGCGSAAPPTVGEDIPSVDSASDVADTDDTASVGVTTGAETDTGPAWPCVWTGDGRPEVLETLGCPADHAALSGSPAGTALLASRSTLFLVERTAENRVHFFDSIRWQHFTYASEMLDGYDDFSVFNSEMYYLPERRLFLGALTHYVDSNIFAVEIAPIDKASPELIEEMFDVIDERLSWPADLRYHPTSNALDMDNRLPANVPVVETDALYDGATFQGLQLGRTIGQVHRVLVSDLDDTPVSRMDILVLDSVPNDLPPVAGLVTGEFQTPLGHVNLLSQNRGTPNMALIGAFDHPDFVSRDSQWVELTVSMDGYALSPSTADEAEAFFEAARPPDIQVPKLDVSVTGVVDIEEVDIDWTPIVGGKAAHFGEMTDIVPAVPLPRAFAIPVAHYVAFMDSTGLGEHAAWMLADDAFREDATARREALAQLRGLITAAEPDGDFIASIEAKIEADFGATRMRFRSSSNVEDIEGFNGAGLYDSISAELGSSTDTVARAVTGVWASLWNDAAFEEREWARIDHGSAAMAILVHPSFPDENEMANGVAVTANPFDPKGQPAYYINVQHGSVSVANPEPGVIPDAFLYYKPPAGQGERTYLSTSNLGTGDPVLAFSEIVALTGYLDDIHRHFESLYADQSPFGMDVEFKLMNDAREIVFKQARPYPF